MTKEEKELGLLQNLLNKGYEEVNSKWFRENMPHKKSIWEYDPRDGWNGCTTEHPDAELIKSDNRIMYSLQGCSIPLEDWNSIPAELNDIVTAMSIRFIKVIVKGETVYKTYTGVPIPDHIINLL